MHNKWEELIPFYVTGTLSQSESQDVEQHLTTCESCQQILNDWVSIANAVHSYAIDQGKELPPLSVRIRDEVVVSGEQRKYHSDNGLHPDNHVSPDNIIEWGATSGIRRRIVKNKIAIPLTLVAVSIIVLIFVGLIVLMTRRSSNDPNTVAFLSENDQLTADASSIITITTAPTDLGILSTPTPTQTQIASIPSIQTPLPNAPTEVSGIGGGDLLPEVDSLLADCSFGNSTNVPIQLHEQPMYEANIVGEVLSGETWLVIVRSDIGWLQVIASNGGATGWVEPNVGTVFGNCAQLPLSTPTRNATPINAFEQCLLGGNEQNPRVTIYSGPNQNLSVVRIMSIQTTAIVSGVLDDGSWYQVQYTDASNIWRGWVQANAITLYFECADVPIIQSDTVEIVPTLTAQVLEPVSTSRATQVNQAQVNQFVASSSEIAPGQTITISWTTQNVRSLWLEYYNPENLPTNTSVFNPDGLFSALPTSGTLSVFVPLDYAYDEIIFSLVVNSYDRNGRLAGETITIAVVD